MSGTTPGGTPYDPDSHLHDPNRHDSQIAALYDTHARAQAARNALVAAGLDPSSVQIVDRASDTGAVEKPGERGILGAIRSLFMRGGEAHGGSQAIGRDHAIVIVTPGAKADRSLAIAVIERTHPLHFNANFAEWRQSGNEYSGSRTSPATISVTRAADTVPNDETAVGASDAPRK